MNNKKILILLIIVFLFFVILIAAFSKKSSLQAETKQVSLGPIYSFIPAIGVVGAKEEATLSSKSNSVVDKIFIKEGETVSAGDKLITFNSPMMEKNLEEIKKNLEIAKIKSDQMKKLLEK